MRVHLKSGVGSKSFKVSSHFVILILLFFLIVSMFNAQCLFCIMSFVYLMAKNIIYFSLLACSCYILINWYNLKFE